MSTLVVLQQMIVLFAMMVIGFFCYKISWLDKHSYGKLSKLVVNVMNPALIVSGVLGQGADSDAGKIWLNVALMGIYFLLLSLLSFVVVKLLRIEKSVESLYRLMMIFSNVGFMGIPVITGIYGESATIYIAFYILGYNFLLYTYGLHLVNRSVDAEKKENPFRKIMNIGVIACVIAIVIFVFRIPVPAPAASLITYMGNPAVPLSMVLIGASMAQQDPKKLFGDVKMYLFLAIRLVLIPIAAALVLKSFTIDAQVAGVFILMLAMPVGSIVVLLAADQGADDTCCTKGSIISTLLSVITIPLVACFLCSCGKASTPKEEEAVLMQEEKAAAIQEKREAAMQEKGKITTREEKEAANRKWNRYIYQEDAQGTASWTKENYFVLEESELTSLLEDADGIFRTPGYIPEGYAFEGGSLSYYLTEDILDEAEVTEKESESGKRKWEYLLPDRALKHINGFTARYCNEAGDAVEIDAQLLEDIPETGNETFTQLQSAVYEKADGGVVWDQYYVGEFFKEIEPVYTYEGKAEKAMKYVMIRIQMSDQQLGKQTVRMAEEL